VIRRSAWVSEEYMGPSGGPHWKRWAEWALAHGIPPNDVPLRSEIVCDDDERRIYYTAYVRDEQGHIMVDHNHAIREQRFVQLEAPALPMPGKYDTRLERYRAWLADHPGLTGDGITKALDAFLKGTEREVLGVVSDRDDDAAVSQ